MNNPIKITNRDGFGTIEWELNGKLHKLDGPAVVNDNVELYEWWINGEELTEKEHKIKSVFAGVGLIDLL